jgi:hypothetical protein
LIPRGLIKSLSCPKDYAGGTEGETSITLPAAATSGSHFSIRLIAEIFFSESSKRFAKI